jgi:hypothetical protein
MYIKIQTYVVYALNDNESRTISINDVFFSPESLECSFSPNLPFLSKHMPHYIAVGETVKRVPGK